MAHQYNEIPTLASGEGYVPSIADTLVITRLLLARSRTTLNNLARRLDADQPRSALPRDTRGDRKT